MLNAKKMMMILMAAILCAGTVCADELQNDWNDFLHYTLINQLTLAKDYARKIIESQPDPVRLLELSQANERGYSLLQRAKNNKNDVELAELCTALWGIIEQGRFLERTDPEIIVAEVNRLSENDRAFSSAVKRLHNAGEYSIPHMLTVLANPDRRGEWPTIVSALPVIGKDAIRPLGVSLQTANPAVKAEVINALGKIKYPQALAYLKYTVENETAPDLRTKAQASIQMIDPAAMQIPAAQLFYRLAQNYYYHAESLAPAQKTNFANVWFWNQELNMPIKEKVDIAYFYELMAMRSCEWALKADANFGPAIGLWIAAYFKAEAANPQMPAYFGQTYADAFTYATTAGPEYLHQALVRAVADKNANVALGVVEALAVNAGEKSQMYRVQTTQPLVQALSFPDRAVRYSAAIAIGIAGPRTDFPEKALVTANLAEALSQKAGETADRWNPELSYSYALRSVNAMLALVQSRNPVVNLLGAEEALITASKGDKPDIQVLAGQVLAHLASPGAQRAIAAMALDQQNAPEIRVAAFGALAVSAKLNANMLDAQSIDAVYELVGSEQTDPQLRAAAAAAYGALNLPSQRVKDLILDQAKS